MDWMCCCVFAPRGDACDKSVGKETGLALLYLILDMVARLKGVRLKGFGRAQEGALS